MGSTSSGTTTTQKTAAAAAAATSPAEDPKQQDRRPSWRLKVDSNDKNRVSQIVETLSEVRLNLAVASQVYHLDLSLHEIRIVITCEGLPGGRLKRGEHRLAQKLEQSQHYEQYSKQEFCHSAWFFFPLLGDN